MYYLCLEEWIRKRHKNKDEENIDLVVYWHLSSVLQADPQLHHRWDPSPTLLVLGAECAVGIYDAHDDYLFAIKSFFVLGQSYGYSTPSTLKMIGLWPEQWHSLIMCHLLG